MARFVLKLLRLGLIFCHATIYDLRFYDLKCFYQIVIDGDDEDSISFDEPNKRNLVAEVSVKVSVLISI